MPFAGALASAALAGATATPSACAALAGRALGGARVASAGVARRPDAPAFCRIALEAAPAPRSRIGTEVWLPLSGWSGRFVQLGTGGFAGTLPEAGMAAEVRRGNAVAVTDTGHKGRDGFDAAWARGAPQTVIDYGYRSLAVSARAAKATVAGFYGAPARYSYFVGCSNGGRQALVAAEREPGDWDGVLAGAPAVAWSEQLSHFAEIQQALRRSGAAIPAGMLPAIQQAARAQCGDAETCAFDPAALRCHGAAGATCLTAAQIAALQPIVRDFDPRWAAARGGWDHWIINADRKAQTQLTFAEQFFREMVLGRSGWRVEDLKPADLSQAARLRPVFDATDRDLAAFRRRGGKLVVYAGSADPVISPGRVTRWFDGLAGRDFARLFVVPGMLHCQGGPEPNAFGQAPIAPAASPDADHDIRRALEDWVERGRPPERLTAVRYLDDDPAKGVVASRTIRARAPQRQAPHRKAAA
jgi:feruloyl esterase